MDPISSSGAAISQIPPKEPRSGRTQAEGSARSEAAGTAPSSRAQRAQEIHSSVLKDGGLELMSRLILEKVEGRVGDRDSAAAPSAELPEHLRTVDATAHNIVSGALSLFDVFRRQNSELEEDQLRTRFEEEIRSGIDEGFRSARGTLEDLGALDDELTEQVAATYERVQDLLAEAFNRSSDEEQAADDTDGNGGIGSQD